MVHIGLDSTTCCPGTTDAQIRSPYRVPELANHVLVMATRNGGRLAQASQGLAMANAGTAIVLPPPVLAFCPGDAAFRHIRDEARAGVAIDHDSSSSGT